MAEPIVLHPLVLPPVLAYLLDQPTVTDIVGERISDEMEPDTSDPRFPCVRVTEVSTVEATARRWQRSLVQFDCWADSQPDADRLARVVAAAMRAAANFSHQGAVLGETTDVTWRPEPDETLDPYQPRAIAEGQVWVRPNP